MNPLEVIYLVSLVGAAAGFMRLRMAWVRLGAVNPDAIEPREAALYAFCVLAPVVNTMCAIGSLGSAISHDWPDTHHERALNARHA